MKKYLLPSLLVLLLGGVYAGAQTYKAAIQLSQDLTGAFSVDTNNGVYFPGHILSTGTNRPAPTVSSGATTPSITGTDFISTITVAAAATTVTETFGQAFVSTPSCLVTGSNSATTISYTVATTSVALTVGSGGFGTANKATILCSSVS